MHYYVHFPHMKPCTNVRHAICSQKNEKYLVAKFGKNVIICYHFVII